MAEVLGDIAKGLASLLTKVEFYVAVIIVAAIIAISGMIGTLATEPYLPGVASGIGQITVGAVALVVIFGICIALVKSAR